MADGQKNGVLIFTFSPVQGFIEASRRTRDFFTGSYILSWLTFQVMWKLKKCNGFNEKDFIYPVPDDQPLWKLFERSKENNEEIDIGNVELLAIANFPNRFVLRLNRKVNKKKLICDVKKYFEIAWKEIYDRVFEEFLNTVYKVDKEKDEHQKEIKRLREQFDLHVKNYFNPFVVIVDEVDKKKYEELFKEGGVGELDQDDSYGFTYDFAERILGSRKTFRPYSGLVDNYTYKTDDDSNKKRGPDGCSVCGERKSLAIDWSRLEGNYDFQGDELCGVCLVKRIGYRYFEEAIGSKLEPEKRLILFGGYSDAPNVFKNFPSTREIAGVKFKESVIENWNLLSEQIDRYISDFGKLEKKVRKFIDAKGDADDKDEETKKILSVARKLWLFLTSRTYPIKKFRFDFTDNRYKFITKDALLFHGEEWRNARQYYSKIKDRLESETDDGFFQKEPEFTYKVDGKENKLKHRNSYFAIVYADGDHMGKWLGLKQEIRGEQLTDEFHREFSRALSKYALMDVPQIVEGEHPGKLVYAGGDDVFAFMHPWDVMPILNELRRSFENRLGGFTTAGDNRPSISAGIVIGHAKAPLKRLIGEVRGAEKRAKEDFGRNAFVIRVVVRSGSVWDFGGKWEYCHDGYKVDVPEIFDRTVNLLKKDGACINGLKCNLSSNFVYDLRDILQSFDEETLDEKTLEVFKILFKRSFQRKFSCTGDDKKAKKKAMEEQMEEYLTLLEAMVRNHVGDAGEKEKNKLYRIVENFINMFYVARFIAKEERV